MANRARAIAFYLPQFHPIPENDEWWGRGFTEWTNTVKANPLFRGHYQPHLPADLGLYDLRVPEVREAQADLARQYGIEGFCYYEYWFAGKRLIERPFNEILASGRPDYPFCICWANQTWTGIWHGAPDRILIEQTYPGMEDHEAHFSEWLKAFRDKRYITVDDKPLLLIYQPMEIPGVRAVTDLWRRLARESGLSGLHLVGVCKNPDWIPKDYGYDASVTPHTPLHKTFNWAPWHRPVLKIKSLIKKWRNLPTVVNYADVYRDLLVSAPPGVENYPCLVPNWDNTPRSGRLGFVLHDSTPELFRAHVHQAMEMTREADPGHRLVFIKSWNEWAEGNHLEPDTRFGHDYLKALGDELRM